MRKRRQQRRIVPEVVQTSGMDCGPASLKAILEGFGISASYGRLREACQTEVDGTSIDTVEELAVKFGLKAEQVMIPGDHVLLPEAAALPALAVVRLPAGQTHFTVLWSCIGGLVQVMDPATGRHWVRKKTVLQELYQHTFVVPAADWREWAGSDELTDPLGARMKALGIPAGTREEVLGLALASPEWLGLAALDATTRMVASLVSSGALRRGGEAARLLRQFLEKTLEIGCQGEQIVPRVYWSVWPVEAAEEAGEVTQLTLSGVVLVRFRGLREGVTLGSGPPPDLPPELAAVLTAAPARPGRDLLNILRKDGLLAPLTLLAGLTMTGGVVLAEALMFRGLIDIGRFLGLGYQRLGAIVAVIALLVASLLLNLPLAITTRRWGRHLETRLRIAFLEKIPRLADRYFHSRLGSDMAERAHNVHALRGMPILAYHLMHACFMLGFTVLGILWLDPASAPVAITVAVLVVAVPLASQRFLIERDLRVKTHAGALSRFYLDAMLGLLAVRCHAAERAVQREHEGLLVEWSRAGLGLLRIAATVQGWQALVGFSLAGWLLLDHLGRHGGSGMMLLLVYWALNLPLLGDFIALTARQYPAQRNITLRLFEPLGAPDETVPAESDQTILPAPRPGCAIAMSGVTVNAGGHTILEEIELALEPGDHVAVVGPSGAGKSSLVGLLLGWHRPSLGSLRVDGQELGPDSLQQLRIETAWIDPAVQLWNRSLYDNLRYGCADRSGVSVASVLESASLLPVLERLPDGMQTQLGEGGGLVSGGEGQRVRLARALLRPGVRLAILDEPFRGLDRAQRRRLLVEARKHWQDATMLCVTHDVGETMGFGRVLVIENGRIVEDGEPELLRHRPGSRYRHLLEAEQDVREVLWGNPNWRRLDLDGGVLSEQGARRV